MTNEVLSLYLVQPAPEAIRRPPMSRGAEVIKPEEWDLTVPELAMFLADTKHGSARLSKLMNKFHVRQDVASYWLKLVKEYESVNA